MPKLLYIDACGGASGDMLAGAFLDLGWPLEQLESHLRAMGLKGVEVGRADVEHMGVTAGRLDVRTGAAHGRHRHLSRILDMLRSLPEEISRPAAAIFQRLARAEAKVHGVGLEEVHFHEVGADDAIVDVVAFCSGLAWCGAGKVACSPLPLGRGFVDCAHGRLPLPAPAVINLLEGAAVTGWPAEEETVTPTGAACISAVADYYGGMPSMRLIGSGIGGGSRPSSTGPNILRLFLGERAAGADTDRIVEIACHLDGQSPEDMPMILERLMAAGALDAAFSPLVMKKGRMGMALLVMARPDQVDELASLVLEQTAGLGVRLRRVERRLAQREIIRVESPWGPARVKAARLGEAVRYHPEADDVAEISRRTGMAPAQVRAKLEKLAAEM